MSTVVPKPPMYARRGTGSGRELIWVFVALLFSQVLLYPPGSDVSPYAFATGQLRVNSIAGFSIQIWALAMLATVVVIGMLHRMNYDRRVAPTILFAVYYFVVVTIFTASSPSAYLDGVGKVVLPLLLYLYASDRTTAGGNSRLGNRMVLVVQVFCIAQVALAGVVTGSFGPNTYYHELASEYFGFFHHPFAFAGMLGIGIIVSIFRIDRRDRPMLNASLIAISFSLIVATQVRTFILAVLCASVVAVATILARRGHVVWSFPLLIAAIAVTAQSLPLQVAGDRVTNDISSGRLDRWISDISFWVETSGPMAMIFGSGPGGIERVNLNLFGVSINSLNFVIDVVVDFGIIGLVVFTAGWTMAIVDAGRRGHRAYVVSLVTFVIVSGLLSNVFEFPGVSLLFAVALTCFRPPSQLSFNESDPQLAGSLSRLSSRVQ